MTIETFLLDPLTGETPRKIRVEFLWRIRDERQFASPESLKAQIFQDVRAAQRYLRRLKVWAGKRLAPA
jgi:riboflavin kinase/FMN adenylyltransferase